MKGSPTPAIHVIRNNVPSPTLHPFTTYFKGFEEVEAVRAVFGEKTETVLRKLKVGFVSNRRMYMEIRDRDGNITGNPVITSLVSSNSSNSPEISTSQTFTSSQSIPATSSSSSNSQVQSTNSAKGNGTQLASSLAILSIAVIIIIVGTGDFLLRWRQPPRK